MAIKCLYIFFIRGTQGTSGWVFSPRLEDPDRTDFQWLLDVDLHLNSFIPRKIIEAGIVTASLDTVNHLRTKLSCTVDNIDILRDPSELQTSSLPGGLPRRVNDVLPSPSNSLR